MSVSQDQAALVRQSFEMVRPMAGQAAGLFYHRLFERAPEVAPLFADADMTRQGHKLMATLNLIAHSLDAPEVAGRIAAELGERHVGYGTRADHFPAVGEALLWTLAQALGPFFDDETRDAWRAAYADLSAAMIAAGTPRTEAAE